MTAESTRVGPVPPLDGVVEQEVQAHFVRRFETELFVWALAGVEYAGGAELVAGADHSWLGVAREVLVIVAPVFDLRRKKRRKTHCGQNISENIWKGNTV